MLDEIKKEFGNRIIEDVAKGPVFQYQGKTYESKSFKAKGTKEAIEILKEGLGDENDFVFYKTFNFGFRGTFVPKKLS